jgi:hypothetical protein
MPFGGETFDPERDGERLSRQLHEVRMFMLSRKGQWFSLCEISGALGFPEASISARLRDLRKKKFGRWAVEARRRDGLRATWEYRLTGEHGEPRRKRCANCERLQREIDRLKAQLAKRKARPVADGQMELVL